MQRILKLFAIFIIVASGVSGWYWMEYNTFLMTPVKNTGSQIYTITSGSSIKKVSQDLYRLGIIEHPNYFKLYARWEKLSSKIKAGEYVIEAGQTPPELLKLFVAGKVKNYHLTIPEGWTFKQILSAIKASPYLIHTLDKLDKEAIMNKLGYPGRHPEGYFYPDTYFFPKGTTDVSFLKRSLITMERILAKEWHQRDKKIPLKTPYEALILASIVEKESGKKSERQKIAGVFIRRLNIKMRLQSDPTIIYGMGDAYKGNIRRKHINQKTAYNTYQIDGLPPTPIASPGVDAIRAVLHPAEGKYLYFVADGSGGHFFSKTLAEHNRAVKKYILKR